jgi:hypothetical protein
MELIPIVDESLKIRGFAERKWSEEHNLCHLTTLLIPVSWNEDSGCKVVRIQVRDARKSFPCCRDVFGGHVALDERFWPFLLGQPLDVGEIVHAAAVREANEELRGMFIKDGQINPWILTEKHVRRVGDIGQAQWNAVGNVERSTMFIVPIPKNGSIHPMDDIDGVFVPVETEELDWDRVRSVFQAHEQYAYQDRTRAKQAGYEDNRKRWQFADGAARILLNDRLFQCVAQGINNLSEDDFTEI